MRKRENRTARRVVVVSASLYGAAAATRESAAVDATLDGMQLFTTAAERLRERPLDKRQGNLFEYIEAAKFNRNAARAGSASRAYVMEANGAPHSPADIEIRQGDHVTVRVQAKSCSNPVRSAHQITKPKYRGMQKLVPKGQEGRVRELAGRRARTGSLKADEYRDTARNATGELHADGVSSGGTRYEESVWAARRPRLYAACMEVGSVAREAARTGAQAAAAGAVVGGAISTGLNLLAVRQGRISVQEAAANVARDAGRSGAKAGVTGGAAALLRYGAAKAGLKTLTRSNVAAAVASGLVDAGVTVHALVKGEITPEEAIEQIGQNGACTLSSFYAGAAAGAVFGPVGVLVGGMAGYLIAANVYQSCATILRQGRLAEEESIRALALCEAASREMERQREAFERHLAATLGAAEAEFDRCFSAIDGALDKEDPEAACQSLTRLAELFGQKLKYSSFAEFDSFMAAGDEPLVL